MLLYRGVPAPLARHVHPVVQRVGSCNRQYYKHFRKQRPGGDHLRKTSCPPMNAAIPIRMFDGWEAVSTAMTYRACYAADQNSQSAGSWSGRHRVRAAEDTSSERVSGH